MADDLSDLYSAYGIALPGAAPPPAGPPPVGAPAAPPLQPGESTITVTPHGAQHPADDLSDLNAAYAAPATPKMGVGQDIAESAGSGLVRGVVGAPVAGASVASGLAGTIMNAGEYAVRKVIGAPKSYHDIKTDNQKAQDAYEAHAVIPGPVQLGAAAQDALTPYLHAPETTPGKVAEGVAEFAPFIAANPASVAQLGVNAPKAVGALTGAANGAENLVAAAPSIAGAAGMIGTHVVAPAVGSQAAGAVADKLAPDFSDEARLAGGFAGGAAAHAAGSAASAAANTPIVGQVAKTLGMPGVLEKQAARKLIVGASDPAKFVSDLDISQPPTNADTGAITRADGTPAPSPDQIVPGSQPTTFQLTGDQGIGQMERGARTNNADGFLDRASTQTRAQTSALAPTFEAGDPNAVPAHLNDQFEAIQADAQQKVDDHLAAAQAAADTATANPGQEVNADALRGVLAKANAAAKEREGILHEAVDPNGTMVTETAPIGQKIADVYGKLSPTEAAFITPEERQFLGLAQQYGPTMPYREAAALSSQLAAAMRKEKATNQGSTPAYRRMTQLMGGVKAAIGKTVTAEHAREMAGIAAGTIAPENTMAARLQARVNEIANSGEQQQAATGLNGGANSQSIQSGQGALDLGGGNTASQGGEGFRAAGGTTGVAADGGFADRLGSANKATIDRKARFEKGVVGEALYPGPTVGTYRARASAVPGKLFQPGAKGYEAVKEYHAAAGARRDAVEPLQHAAMDALRGKIGADGVLKQADLNAFKSRYSNALRAMDEVSPGFSSKFDSAPKATDAMLAAKAQRDRALKDYQAGAVGKIMKAGSSDEVVTRVGDALKAKDGVTQTKALVAAAKENPDALAGLRTAAAQSMAKEFTSLHEAGTSGDRDIEGNRFRKVFEARKPALAEVLPPEDMENYEKVANDLDRTARSIRNRASAGPGTAGDLAQAEKAGGHGGHGSPSSFLGAVVTGAIIGHEVHGGAHGAAYGGAAGAGSYLLKTLRSAGIHNRDAMVADALLNPDRARQYIKRLSPNEYREKAHAGLVQQSLLGNGPRDRDDSGPGGSPPSTPPSTGPFSPSGRGASASPLATDERGRIEPTAPEIPGSRGNVVRVARPSDLNAAAAHVDTNPTEAQAAANNYRHGHAIVEGLPVSIENPRGSTRSGVGDDGKPWSVRMPADYGYFKASKGADGDHIDTYVGRRPSDGTAHVIDQVHPDTGVFDESKVLLHAGTAEQAAGLYKRGFSDGKGADRIGDITTLPIDQLKEWLSKPQTRPMSEKLRALAEARDKDAGQATPSKDSPLVDSGRSRVDAALSLGREFEAAGIGRHDLSRELTGAAHDLINKGGHDDHAQALEDAALSRLPEDVKDAAFSETAPDGVNASSGESEKAGDSGRGSSKDDGDGEGSRSSGEAGQGPRGRQSAPQHLVSFLKAAGGIQDQGGNLKASGLDRRFKGLVRADGLPLDRAREMAAEEGYLGHDTENAVSSSTINDMIDKLGEHPSYSTRDQALVDATSEGRDRRAYTQKVTAARQRISDTLKGDYGFQDGDLDHRMLRAAADHLIAGHAPLEAYGKAIRDSLDKDQEMSSAARAAWAGDHNIPFFGDEDATRAGNADAPRGASRTPVGAEDNGSAPSRAARGNSSQPQYASQGRQSAGAIGETIKAAVADAGHVAPAKATSLPFSPERSTKPIVSEIDGSSVQPVRTSSFSDMMHELDVSGDQGAEPLLRGNSMAIGDMLSRRIGDIPVHVVDEAGMRKMTSMRFHGDDSVPAGFYEGGNRNRIVLLDRYMEDKSSAAHLMLHEGLHAAFSQVIDSSAPTREIIDHLRDYATATHLEGGGNASDHYGLSNPHEFVSEAFSNPDFQRFLSGIQAPDYLVKALGIGKTGAQPTIWDAFTAAVRRILRVPNGQHSLLDAAMRVVPMLESLAPHDAATSKSSPSLGASP